MAKKAYVGVDNIARKVKNGYVGVRTAFPIYETQTTTENVTINSDALLSKYFTVTNSGYGFAWNIGYSQFRNLNSGSSSSTSQVTLTALQDCTVTYTYIYGTENKYDKFTLNVKGSTIHNAVSGVGTATTRTDTLTKGQTIVFLYTKDGSVDNNGDYVAFYNMSATITTTKEVQVGTDYRNVARKIKKAYIGIGGVARPCWSGGEVVKFGTITRPYKASEVASTSIEGYALFAGGRGEWSTTKKEFPKSKSVIAYDEYLTRSSAPSLSEARWGIGSASLKNKLAFFVGGSDGDVYGNYSADVYDTSLTLKDPSSHMEIMRGRIGASTNNYALFAGGIDYDSLLDKSKYNDSVRAYDEFLTLVNAEDLTKGSTGMSPASMGGYAIFAGGASKPGNNSHVSDSALVYCYDDSLTLTLLNDLKDARTGMASAVLDDKYAIFAGGYTDSTGSYRDLVDCYDKSLTKVSIAGLSVGRRDMVAFSLEGYAVFTGGYSYSDSNVYWRKTEMYDDNLTRTLAENLNLSYDSYGSVSAVVGNYAITGFSNSLDSPMEVYMLS